MIYSHRCVVCVLAGHLHDGAYYLDCHGVHHLTLEGVIETPPESNAFGTIYVYEDKMVLKGRGRIPDRVMPFWNTREIQIALLQEGLGQKCRRFSCLLLESCAWLILLALAQAFFSWIQTFRSYVSVRKHLISFRRIQKASSWNKYIRVQNIDFKHPIQTGLILWKRCKPCNEYCSEKAPLLFCQWALKHAELYLPRHISIYFLWTLQ